jgi:hypothetical protein
MLADAACDAKATPEVPALEPFGSDFLIRYQRLEGLPELPFEQRRQHARRPARLCLNQSG